jgi:mevalonate kinase
MSHKEEKIVVSAPGKVILHGEHSVVYGKLALATSIDLRVQVTLIIKMANMSSHGQLHIRFIDLNKEYKFEQSELRKLATPASSMTSLNSQLVDQIKTFVQSLYPSDAEDLGVVALLYMMISTDVTCLNRTMEISVSSEIPVGAGLGSSASFSVALSGAFMQLQANDKAKGEKNTYICTKKYCLGETLAVQTIFVNCSLGCNGRKFSQG